MALRGLRNFLNREKRAKQIALAVLLILLTVSIVLAVPETITNTKTNIVQKGENSRNDEGAMEWNKTYGGAVDDEGWCVEQTTDGGYIITGYTESFDSGANDVWLIKTDANGDEEWSKTFGVSGDNEGYCVKQTIDGGYIITGVTESFDPSDNVWLIKTFANGTEDWNKTYGGSQNDHGYYVEQTSDGGYIITGYTASFAVGNTDVWLIKTDQNGDHIWNQTYGGANDERGWCVAQTSDTGYIITGHNYSNGDWDVLLIKTAYDGTFNWSRTFGGTNDDESCSVKQTTDGGYIIAGFTSSFGAGLVDAWLIKTNADGDHVWNQTYGGESWDDSRCVEQTSDGGYIITGVTGSLEDPMGDVWLIKTDSNGNEIWNQTYGGTNSDWSYCVDQTSDGGYIIIGNTNSYGVGGIDIYLIKVSPDIPVIDQPVDIVYEEDSTGNSITWHPRDLLNPHMFNVTRNNTLVDSGLWDGGDITVNVDDLSVGTYIFTCSVNDTESHDTSDSVTVTVTPKQVSEFLGYTIFLALAVIGLAIIWRIVLAKRKR